MENEIGEIIMTGDIEVDHEENLESEEIEDIEDGTMDVIPFHLINVVDSKEEQEEQASTSRLQQDAKFSTAKGVKYYKQTYRPAWELMPDFKGWLKGVKGEPTRAFCTYCRKTLHAHRLSLLKHTCTIRHQKAAQLNGNSTNNYNIPNLNMSDNEIQTVIVNDEGLLMDPLSSAEEDNSNNEAVSQLLQPDVVYDEQESPEEAENSNSSAKSNFNQNIFPISTNVTDVTRGSPVMGLAVSLYKLIDGRWTYINEGLTDNKGRCSIFFSTNKFSTSSSTGRYKLHYDVNKYFEFRKQESPFPFVEIVFDCPTLSKYHFTLLLGPNTYTTYRSNCSE